MKTDFWLYLLVMGGVTYLLRMVPFAAVRKKVESPFLKSFLFYVPYAVLAAMTIPDIFYSTRSIWSAAAGLAAAMVLALKKKNVVTVAVAACITVYLTEWMMKAAGIL